MITKRRVFTNALMSTVQVVVTGGLYVIFYRYLLDSIGKDSAGVWSLVLSWTSIVNIVNLGLPGTTVKFVSKHLAREDTSRASLIIQTSVLSVAGLSTILIPLLYPLFRIAVGHLVEPSYFAPEALSIIPHALASLWLSSVTAVLLSCIDGTQRVYLSNVLQIVSTLLYMGLAYALIPERALVGLAEAQVIQGGALLFISWFTLRRLLRALPWLPHRWSRDVLREVVSYSLNLQVISFSAIFVEPVAKSLIAKFGGVGAVFFYQMAAKMVHQLRALIVTTYRSILPAIAHLHETDATAIREIYRQSFQLLLVFVLTLLPMFIVAAPMISRLWLGSYEQTFVVFTVLLLTARFFNVLAAPAYFAYLGTGRLRWITTGHLLTATLNAALGGLLGWWFGEIGVVVGISLAITIGSAVVLTAYHREHKVQLRPLIQRSSAVLGSAAVLGLLFGMLIYEYLSDTLHHVMLLGLVLGVYGVLVTGPLIAHPATRMMRTWLRAALKR